MFNDWRVYRNLPKEYESGDLGEYFNTNFIQYLEYPYQSDPKEFISSVHNQQSELNFIKPISYTI